MLLGGAALFVQFPLRAGAAGTDAAVSRPAGAVNILSATGEGNSWRGPVTKVRSKEGNAAVEIRPVGDILHGTLELTGPAADWSRYSRLLLDLESTVPGTLNVTVRESDGGEFEPWIAVLRLSSERETLTVRLAPKPEGDLILGGPQRDRVWNPDSADRLTLTLTSGGGNLRIYGIDLVPKVPDDGAAGN